MASLKETIKSIVLVGLILMTVILSRFILLDATKRTFEASDEVGVASVDVTQYINPQSFLISFGGLSYTKIDDTVEQEALWNALEPTLIHAVNDFDTVEMIDKETYVAAFSDKSIMLRFPFGLDFQTWLSLYDSTIELPNAIGGITPYELVFKGDSPLNLYIYDKDEDTYYHMTSTSVSVPVSQMVTEISDKGFIEYRKISDRFSLFSTVPDDPNRFNYELLPYQYNHMTKQLKIKNEVSLESDAFDREVNAIATTVFGNRLDFVKQLEDVNGAIVLMYGYGDKALTVDTSGEISFNQKFNVNTAKDMPFGQSLAVAIGMFEKFGIIPEGVRLASFTREDDVYPIWTFSFEYQLNDIMVSPLSGFIEVTVKGGQPIAIKKNVKRVVSITSVNYDEMFTIDNCISLNYLEVSLYYLQDNDIYDQATNNFQYYFPIRSAISSINLEYYQIDMQMIPVWRVVISERTYIFNAYTGEMIRNFK